MTTAGSLRRTTEYQVFVQLPHAYLFPSMSNGVTQVFLTTNHPLWSINGADHNVRSPFSMYDRSRGFGAHLMADSSIFDFSPVRKVQSDLG